MQVKEQPLKSQPTSGYKQMSIYQSVSEQLFILPVCSVAAAGTSCLLDADPEASERSEAYVCLAGSYAKPQQTNKNGPICQCDGIRFLVRC